MLEASLGINTTTWEGLRDLAIIVVPICLVFGFFADFMLARLGFGVLGNGIIAVTGMYVTMKLIDSFLLPAYTVNLAGPAILSAAAGGLFLAALSAIKRRFL